MPISATQSCANDDSGREIMNENNNLKRYFIVKESPLRIISKCRRHSKGTLMGFLGGICLIYAIVNWIPELMSIAVPVTNIDIMMNYVRDADPSVLNMLPSTPMVVYIYALMFSGVFNLGECLYSLTYIRNRKVEYRAAFEGFPYYIKTLGLFVLQTVIVAFWTLLFIIPGIIAALNFSQSYYILADDPSKGITEALGGSKVMMYGNKMTYVRLILYYLPYILISYIPAYILADASSGMDLSGTALTVIGMIAELPVFAACGYMRLGQTVFYELMINRGFADFKYAGQDAFRELENINER